MNFEQIISIVRQVLLFVGGFIVAKGWIDQTTLATIIGALITLGTSFWATYTRRNNGLIASAAGVTTVDHVVVNDAQTARDVPASNVVSK